jgi:hypothetical protein
VGVCLHCLPGTRVRSVLRSCSETLIPAITTQDLRRHFNFDRTEPGCSLMPVGCSPSGIQSLALATKPALPFALINARLAIPR